MFDFRIQIQVGGSLNDLIYVVGDHSSGKEKKIDTLFFPAWFVILLIELHDQF